MLDGSLNADIQVGIESTDTVTLAVGDMSGGTLGIDAASIDIGSTGDAAAALTALDTAFESLLTERAKVGAMQNRMDVKVENLTSTYANTSASHGRIVDLDIASEMANFTKNQVLSQAGTSMLAQANSLPQSALGLLG